MANEISFGYLYIPTENKGNKGIFRDIYLFFEEQLFCRDYLSCGSESRLFESVTPIESSQLHDFSLGDAVEIANILGIPSFIAKVTISKLYDLKKLIRRHKDTSSYQQIWPKTLAQANVKGAYYRFLNTGNSALNSDPALRQNSRIVEDAKEELTIFRLAFSDDLINLYTILEKLKNGCKVNLNLASAEVLTKACNNEIDELNKRKDIFTSLRTNFDVQAKSKYLKDANANFARAACDSLCAIRAAQNYIQYYSDSNDAKRFNLSLFAGEPSFRGTISERDIGYVDTEPWVPGMAGVLHSHTRDPYKDPALWDQAKRGFLSEIKSSVKPIELDKDFYQASNELSSSALNKIYEAKHRPDKTREDINRLEKMIKEIEHIKPTSKSDVHDSFEKIQDYRKSLRDTFGEIFPRLDEQII